MTGLLTPPRDVRTHADADASRPVVVGALLAGSAAAVSMLVALMALALAAWFSADQGSHGTTRDALRIGADAWLLGHGSALDVGVTTITVMPLGLTLLCAYVCYRLGRWAAATSVADDVTAVALAAVVLAAVYGALTTLVAVLASVPGAEPQIARSGIGGFVVALVGGLPGLLVGSGHLPGLMARVPQQWRAVAFGGALVALVTFVLGGVLVAVALLADLGAAANVLSRLHVDAAAGALYTVVVAGVAPNAALFGAAYLTGPGFAVGAGTSVSVTSVAVGPVPAFPLLAALPANGEAPWWTAGLLALPVVGALYAGRSAVRAFPVAGYRSAALCGAGSGVFGAVFLAGAVWLAGGAVGPGRMQEVGAGFLEPLLFAALPFAIGAALGAVFQRWRQGPLPDGTEPTVDLSAGEPTVAVRRRRLFRRG
jgi:hypothetical protein